MSYCESASGLFSMTSLASLAEYSGIHLAVELSVGELSGDIEVVDVMAMQAAESQCDSAEGGSAVRHKEHMVGAVVAQVTWC